MKRMTRCISFMVLCALLFNLSGECSYAASNKTNIMSVKQAGSDSVVKITWKKTGSVKKYSVYRSTKKNGKYTKIKTVKSKKAKITYKDKTVKYGTTYYYKIKGKGLKFSKIKSVKVKNSIVNNVTPTPLIVTEVPAESSIAPQTITPFEEPKVTTSPVVTLNPDEYVPIDPSAPSAEPTPAPTVDPSAIVDADSLGTEGEDYISATGGDVIDVTTSTTVLLSGDMTDTTIRCQADNISVCIALDGVNINNTSVPFIINEYAGTQITITSIGTSENYITASESYSSEDEVISSEGNILFNGGGVINIDSNKSEMNAVKSEQSLAIENGVINVTSKGKGFVGKPFVLEGGIVTVNSSDDGIKAKGKTGAVIKGGNLSVTSQKDGISSNKLVEITGGNTSINAGDDGIQCEDTETDETTGETTTVKGVVNMSEENTTVSITSKGKGIKAGYINVSGGTYIMNSSDHAFSAAGNLTSGDSNDTDSAINISGGNFGIKVEATLTQSSQNTGGMWGGFGGMENSKTTYEVTGGDAFNSNSGINIANAGINITGCADAVQAENNVNISNCIMNIYAYGKGIKGGYTLTADTASYYGTVTVDGGTYKIISYDDAIHCNNDVNIKSGNIELYTCDDGVHADNNLYVGVENGNDSDLSVKVDDTTMENNSITPFEGLEAAYMYIYSGNIETYVSDDGINLAGGVDSSGSNSGSTGGDSFGPGNRPGGFGGGGMMSSTYGELYVYGGDIYINADGDSIDSNGKIVIEGGNIVIDGSANGADDIMDSETGITVNGGNVCAVGRSGVSTQSGASGSTQYNVLFKSGSQLSAGTTYEVRDSAENVIVSGTTLKQTNVYFFSSDRFEEGTYSLYIDGTKKTTVTFSGTDINKTINF